MLAAGKTMNFVESAHLHPIGRAADQLSDLLQNATSTSNSKMLNAHSADCTVHALPAGVGGFAEQIP